MTRKLACKESIADLWGHPYCSYPKTPDTESLFRAISAEAEMCLHKTNWDVCIRRIENILSIIKERMRRYWEEQHGSDLDRILRKAKEDGENVG